MPLIGSRDQELCTAVTVQSRAGGGCVTASGSKAEDAGDQATAAKLSRKALSVASISASEWAREVNPASKAEGAR